LQGEDNPYSVDNRLTGQVRESLHATPRKQVESSDNDCDWDDHGIETDKLMALVNKAIKDGVEYHDILPQRGESRYKGIARSVSLPQLD